MTKLPLRNEIGGFCNLLRFLKKYDYIKPNIMHLSALLC